MLLNNRACQNSDPPTNKKCYSLHQQLPELRNISSIIQSGKEKVELCSSYSLCKKTTPHPLTGEIMVILYQRAFIASML